MFKTEQNSVSLSDIRTQLWIQHLARYLRPRCQGSHSGGRWIWLHAVNIQLRSRFSSPGYWIWPAIYKNLMFKPNHNNTQPFTKW